MKTRKKEDNEENSGRARLPSAAASAASSPYSSCAFSALEEASACLNKVEEEGGRTRVWYKRHQLAKGYMIQRKPVTCTASTTEVTMQSEISGSRASPNTITTRAESTDTLVKSSISLGWQRKTKPPNTQEG